MPVNMQRLRSKIWGFLFLALLALGAGIYAAFIGLIGGEDFSYLVFAITDFPIIALGWIIIFFVIPSPEKTKKLLLPHLVNLFKAFLCGILLIFYFALASSFSFHPVGPWIGRIIIFMGLLSVFLVYELFSKRARARDEAEEKNKRIFDAIRTQNGVTLKELATEFETTELDIEMSIWKLQEEGRRVSIDRETGEVIYEG